jgi:hypothetical protein
MTTAAKKYITPDELVVRWAGVYKKGTLANQRSQHPEKHPPFIKRGSKVLYPVAELEAWEAANDNIKKDDTTK